MKSKIGITFSLWGTNINLFNTGVEIIFNIEDIDWNAIFGFIISCEKVIMEVWEDVPDIKIQLK